MTTTILVVVCLGLVLQAMTLAYRWRTQVEIRQILGEVWQLLQITKGWAGSARTHSKEAALTVQAVKGQGPEAERHVLEAVEAVPGKTAQLTADQVVERIKSDSGSFQKPADGAETAVDPPPPPPGGPTTH